MYELTNTEIHILEYGLGWIHEAQEIFATKLFNRLLRDHPEANPFLQEMGLQSFSRHIFPAIERIIGDLHYSGKIRSPLREQWPELHATPVRPFDPEQFSRMAETFLDVLSELAEDAWSPAMEFAWRKAIHKVSIHLWGKQSESLFPSKMLSPIQFITRRKHRMSHPLVFFLVTLMILAGGIASIGLWSRCRLAEVKLQRKPSLKKVWCS
jgi:hemoglobin-like flavoprotein